MNAHRISIRLFCLALTFGLTACSSRLGEQTPPPQATSSASDLATFFVAIPEPQAQESPEQTAERMFVLWLDHFRSPTVEEHVRLDDYEIKKVVLPPEFQYCVQDLGIEYIARVVFSVRTSDYPSPDWAAGNGTIGDDHWINDKSVDIAVFRVSDTYSFRVLGAPACAGIAIDGTRVP